MGCDQACLQENLTVDVGEGELATLGEIATEFVMEKQGADLDLEENVTEEHES